MASNELKNRTSVTKTEEDLGTPQLASPKRDRDDEQLQRMGKKPVLQRNFGMLSILGVSCTILATWEGLLGTFIGPLTNGGSGGAVYAYIFGWVGTLANFIVLAELASMAPTAGGQYHWAAMLAPAKYMKLVSYITGWFAVLGWQTAFAASSFLAGSMIQGAAVLGNDSYHPKPWQATLITWASLSLALLINLAGGKLLPRAEAILLVVHILGAFAIIIPLVYLSDHNTAHQVFLSFKNGGNFDTQGLSWFVGMTACAFAFGGADGAVHMAEEVANASMVIPKALMLSVGINGSLGFGILIAMLFCADADLGGKVGELTGYPYMGIFMEATKSVPGSLAMSAIVIAIFICAMMGLLAASSRQLWSFSRDRGVPGWRWVSQISPSRQLPIPALLVSVTIAALLAIIRIGSSVAMEDIVSMAISGIYLSYLIVTVLLLVRRVRGDISLHNDSEDDIINVPGAKLVWGPFRISGIVGSLINAYAVVYITIIVFFSFWPSKVNPTVEEMNWSILAIGGAMCLALLYYVFRARHIYNGPIVELAL